MGNFALFRAHFLNFYPRINFYILFSTKTVPTNFCAEGTCPPAAPLLRHCPFMSFFYAETVLVFSARKAQRQCIAFNVTQTVCCLSVVFSHWLLLSPPSERSECRR